MLKKEKEGVCYNKRQSGRENEEYARAKKERKKKLICIHAKKNMFIIIASEVIGFLLAIL
jgi:hypothetical protein